VGGVRVFLLRTSREEVKAFKSGGNGKGKDKRLAIPASRAVIANLKGHKASPHGRYNLTQCTVGGANRLSSGKSEGLFALFYLGFLRTTSGAKQGPVWFPAAKADTVTTKDRR